MRKSILLSGAMIIAGLVMMTGIATAQTSTPTIVGDKQDVHIADNGQVAVKGARITALGDMMITATTSWGAHSISWSVKTDGAKLTRRYGGSATLAEMSVGDFINFRGMLDLTASQPVVKATNLENASIQKRRASFSGTIETINANAQSFTLKTENRGTVTVLTNASTTIFRGSATSSFAGLQVNDRVATTSGLLNNQGNVLTADRINVLATKPASVRTNFEGKLKSVTGVTAPTSLVLTIGRTDFTVNVAVDTAVLNNNFVRTGLVNFKVGDKIRVYGTLQTGTQIIDATIVRDTSIR